MPTITVPILNTRTGEFDIPLANDFPLNPPFGGNHVIPAGQYTLRKEGGHPNQYGVYSYGNPSGVKLANVGVTILSGCLELTIS